MLAPFISRADRCRGNIECGPEVGDYLQPAIDHSAVESQQPKSIGTQDHGEEETVHAARK
jgi:hypothetical protein